MNNILNQLLDKINLGIILINEDQKIVIWNNWLERLTKKSKEEVFLKDLKDICPKFAEELFQDILKKAIVKGQRRFCSGTIHKAFVTPSLPCSCDKIDRHNLIVEPLYHEDKRYVLLQIHDISSHYNQVLELKGVLRSIENDYEKIKESAKKNKKLAFEDPLTGLSNRLSFMDNLERAIVHASMNKELLAVMFIDIDGFKDVNDTYGHVVGDDLLKLVAATLKGSTRSTDMVARLGGDEFSIFLAHIKTIENLEFIAKKMLKSFESPVVIDNIQVKVNLSIGISVYPKDGEDATKLIKNSDTAMYFVKKTGKNNYNFF